MSQKEKSLEQKIAALVAAAGLTAAASASAATSVPRGENVGSLAGNCSIGAFPQTSKAGPYNVLCNVMKDSEKCLAFLKGHFHFNGQTVDVRPVNHQEEAKAEYCLDVLKQELGL
jgi:hypothetical protein